MEYCFEIFQDFLATNRPEFLENVETRRRYMSELSELRQLKREKRKQFLAIAGSSGFLKPQRPPKGPAGKKKKKHLKKHGVNLWDKCETNKTNNWNVQQRTFREN